MIGDQLLEPYKPRSLGGVTRAGVTVHAPMFGMMPTADVIQPHGAIIHTCEFSEQFGPTVLWDYIGATTERDIAGISCHSAVFARFEWPGVIMDMLTLNVTK